MRKNHPSLPDKAAIIAPTIITEEIAFVTDINVYVTMVLHSTPHNTQQILII